MQDKLSRRGLLGAGAAGLLLGLASKASAFGASVAAPVAVPAAQPGGAAKARKRSLRLAHLTDIHIQPERGATEGLAQCLRHLGGQSDKAQLIVTGGDLIMDSFAADEARTKLQWELLTKAFRDNTALPIAHTLGNHDIWGWNKAKSKTSGAEQGWGKARALDVLGMKRSYHSHDQAGWHIVHLDSVSTDPNNPNGYIGKIDDEQLDWLKADLAAVKTGTFTLIVSHIPIFTATVLTGKREADGALKVSPGEMHVDSDVLRGIFEKSGNVKACISGHIHRIDKIDFRGVRYCCNGAVSGSWWKGPNAEAFEGYTLVDLFDDGSVECNYTGYGWTARA